MTKAKREYGDKYALQGFKDALDFITDDNRLVFEGDESAEEIMEAARYLKAVS